MNTPASPQQYLAISALGEDHPDLLDELTSLIGETGCNIITSRAAILGGEAAVFLLAGGSWNEIAKLEAQLPALSRKQNLELGFRRTENHRTSSGRPYLIEVVAIDQPGILCRLTQFLSSRSIHILDISSDSFHSMHGNILMFSANLTINLPAALHLPRLREEFFDFCDALNLDAMLEPAKH